MPQPDRSLEAPIDLSRARAWIDAEQLVETQPLPQSRQANGPIWVYLALPDTFRTSPRRLYVGDPLISALPAAWSWGPDAGDRPGDLMPAVRARDLLVHYLERGTGEPAVLVHGNWATSSWWEPVLDRLPAAVRGIAPDLRGRGRTAGPDSDYSIPSLAGDLAAFADPLGLERFHLVGHSLGSAVAMELALTGTLALQLPDVTGGPVGISMPPLFGGDRVASYYLAAAIFALALAASLAVRYTRAHYAVSAIRSNEAVAAVMGVDVVRTKVALFVASATLAALAGAFYMPFITHTDPQDAFDISRSVAALVFPIFGGIYTTAGPVVGTLALRSFEEYLRVTPPWKEGYQVMYGAVIVIAVLFLPRGILGLVRRHLGGRAAQLMGGRRWRSSR